MAIFNKVDIGGWKQLGRQIAAPFRDAELPTVRLTDPSASSEDIRLRRSAATSTGLQYGAAAAGIAAPLAATGIGLPVAAGIMGGAALVGSIVGAIRGSKAEKERQKLEAQAEKASEAASVEAAKQAKLSGAQFARAKRQGFPVADEDASLVTAAGTGTNFDSWKLGVFS